MDNKLAPTAGANALAAVGTIKPIYGTISDEEKLRKIGIDPAAPLADEVKADLIRLYNEQMAAEGPGTVTKYKILKDSRLFETPAGDTVKEVRGVIMYHSSFVKIPRTRWVEGEKRPVCKSLDGVTGTFVDDQGLTCEQRCAECMYNSRSPQFDAAMEYNKQCKASAFLALLVKDVPTPVVITLAPTMIKHARKFIDEKMIGSGIPTIAREVVITLAAETNEKGTWAVPQFALGDPVPAPEFVRLCNLRKEISVALALYTPEKEDIQGEEDPVY